MLGAGLCDCNCGRPSSIRMTKRLGQEGASWALRLVHCVDGCTVSSLFAVFGHSLNTVIIRGLEGGGGRNQPALQSEHHGTWEHTQVSGSVNLGRSSQQIPHYWPCCTVWEALVWPNSCEHKWTEFDVIFDCTSV